MKTYERQSPLVLTRKGRKDLALDLKPELLKQWPKHRNGKTLVCLKNGHFGKYVGSYRTHVPKQEPLDATNPLLVLWAESGIYPKKDGEK